MKTNDALYDVEVFPRSCGSCATPIPEIFYDGMAYVYTPSEVRLVVGSHVSGLTLAEVYIDNSFVAEVTIPTYSVVALRPCRIDDSSSIRVCYYKVTRNGSEKIFEHSQLPESPVLCNMKVDPKPKGEISLRFDLHAYLKARLERAHSKPLIPSKPYGFILSSF